MNKPAMPPDSRLYRDKSQTDLGPKTLGLKDIQLLALQETDGPRSKPQIHALVPNSASVPFFVWAGNTQKVYSKGAGEEPCVGCLVLCLRI